MSYENNMGNILIERAASTVVEAMERAKRDFESSGLYTLELWMTYHVNQFHMRYVVENNIYDVTDLDHAYKVLQAFVPIDQYARQYKGEL
jgi:hypothetical protein